MKSIFPTLIAVLLFGASVSSKSPNILIIVSDDMGNWDIAVYRPPWKLIIPAVQGKPQLFDVVEDPYEKKDVIRENPEITQTLTKIGQAMIARAKVSP